jgi:TolB-like protein
MLRLTTLGTIDLRAGDGRSVLSVLQQPKRLALLVYLSLSRPGTFARRDTLLALFWPESDERSARNALSQALHRLRTSLGPDVIVARGDDEVGIERGRLWCDVMAFREALERGDHSSAAFLYGGEFLRGFHVDASSEFEQWVDEVRARLEREATALPEAAGTPAAPQSPLPAPVSLLGPASTGALEQGEGVPGEFAPEQSKHLPRSVLAVAVLVLGAASTAVLGATFMRHVIPRPSAAGVPALAEPAVTVPAFRDHTTRPELRPVASAATDALASYLVSAGIRVLSGNGLDDRWRRAGVPGPGEAGSVSIRGSVVEGDDRVRLGVEFVDDASGTVLSSRTVDRPLEDVIALVDGATAELGVFVRTTLGQVQADRRLRHAAPSARALDLVDQGTRHMERVRQFRGDGSLDAVLVSLRYADSLLALAETEAPGWSEATVGRARVAARGAWASFLADPADAGRIEAYLARGLAHADRAVGRAPGDAAALEIRGTILRWHSLLPRLGDAEAADFLDRAEADLRAAVAADPGRARAWGLLGEILYRRARFAESLWASTNAYESDRFLDGTPDILARAFAASYETADNVGARRWCDEITRSFPGQWLATECQLKILARIQDPRTLDPASIVAAITHEHGDIITARLEMLAATALARAGAGHETEPLIQRAHARSYSDPELLHLEAETRIALGQVDSAKTLLDSYVRGAPFSRGHAASSRRFAVLELVHRTAAPPDGNMDSNQ